MGANPTAHFETTMGEFEAELYLDRTPLTVSNFVDLCRRGFYDGLHFHRVIEGFMNQFGCPFAKDPFSAMAGKGGPPVGRFKNLKTGGVEHRIYGVTGTGVIRDEHTSPDANVSGTLSMANVGQKNSGGSQIFFNVGNNHNLDWFTPGESKHPVFGMVRKGMGVVKEINSVQLAHDGSPKPLVPIRMLKVTIVGAPEAELMASVSPKRDGDDSSSSSSSSSKKKRKKKEKKRKKEEKKKRKRSSSSSSSDRKRRR